MELSTILLETASSKLSDTASSLQSLLLTDNNGYFLFCMFFVAWLPWRLSLEFRLDRPVPNRWWLPVNVVLFWIMGHYFVHCTSLLDCIPDDFKHTWMALPGAFVH
ncbi:hypothetical protein CSOJ01_08383 [Colletotrichum sojae]|uniref:Uncharacterized protein n=1 Tax=Colletotrichum sojae TaxID=2175907 RepID=A0A8H6J6R0_9PEZI|nr:hypothetical protein CSOJ01_08383 [Colletotrichum sojae]